MTITEIQKYSQYGEQAMILSAVPERGKYLDIGAWNPKVFSNSRALYELGWDGVMIEPSPAPFLSLLDEYGNDPRIALINAAIGPERCCVKFHCTDDAVSTTNDTQYETWKEHAKFRGSYYAPQFTLGDLFNQFGGAFDFINIDVEGGNFWLFAELLRSGVMPSCICVEFDDHFKDIEFLAAEKGYKRVGFTTANLVFGR